MATIAILAVLALTVGPVLENVLEWLYTTHWAVKFTVYYTGLFGLAFIAIKALQ